MKIINLLIMAGLFISLPTYAKHTVDVSANQFLKKGIPYCTHKITRGCVKPSERATGKYYFAPKYSSKTAKNAKVSKKKNAFASLPQKHKKTVFGKPSKATTYNKSKQSKRALASALEQKLKHHKKK